MVDWLRHYVLPLAWPAFFVLAGWFLIWSTKDHFR